jgi:hypothetical protein
MHIPKGRSAKQKRHRRRREQLSRERRTHLQLKLALDHLKAWPVHPTAHRRMTSRAVRRLSELAVRAYLRCAHKNSEDWGPDHPVLVGVGPGCIPQIDVPQRRCIDCGAQWDRHLSHLVVAA